jgi:hypothetical protein
MADIFGAGVAHQPGPVAAGGRWRAAGCRHPSGVGWFRPLCRGGPKVAPARELDVTQRRNWVVAYTFAVVAFSAGFVLLERLSQAYGHSAGERINEAAVAFLRGLALAAIVVSLFLGHYLRAKTSAQR